MKSSDELLDEGLAALERGDASTAVKVLEPVVAEHPDDADVRHALGLAYEDVGDDDGMKREFLQVRMLDAAADRQSGLGTADELLFIEEAAAEVLSHLPEPFRSRLGGVPIVLEKRPSMDLVRSGFDPRALGVFEGASVLEHDHPELPTRIVLFTHNLLAEFHDADELAAQIEVTLIHEIGHFFGMSEEDMELLDLD